jgi:hypothetical protein
MKVYVLYDNPYDDGWNVYGVFSTEEKLKKALEKFTPESQHELNWAFFELDDLEKFFDVSKLKTYSGYSPVYIPLNEKTIKLVTWKIVYESGLDKFLQDEIKKDSIYFFGSHLDFSIKAKDEEESIQKANEMLKELIQQPEDERGWKWLEK